MRRGRIQEEEGGKKENEREENERRRYKEGEENKLQTRQQEIGLSTLRANIHMVSQLSLVDRVESWSEQMTGHSILPQNTETS